MNLLRTKQISNLVRKDGLSKINLPNEIEDINSKIINIIGTDILEEYVNEKYKKMTRKQRILIWNRIENLFGIIVNENETDEQIFFKIIKTKILLPNYLEGWKKEDIFSELDKLIDNLVEEKERNIQNKLGKNIVSIDVGDYNEMIKNFDLEMYFDRRFKFPFSPVSEISFVIDNYIEDKNLKGGFTVISSLLVELPEKKSNLVVRPQKKDINRILLSNFPKKIKGIFTNEDDKHGISCYIESSDDANMLEIFFYSTNLVIDDNISFSTDQEKELGNKITKKLFSTTEKIANQIHKTSNKESKGRHIVVSRGYATGSDTDKSSSKARLESLEKTFSSKIIEMKDNDKVYFDDIGGLLEVKKQAKQIIRSIEYNSVYKKHNATSRKGILLYGPPGTGKTMFGKLIATEADFVFLNINTSDIINKYLGESAKNMSELFEYVKLKGKLSKKVILFLDEIDSLLGKRGKGGNTSGETDAVITTFLKELDGLKSDDNFIVIGTTNNIKDIDEAVLRSGRMSTKLEIPLPDKDGVKSIYKIKIKKGNDSSSINQLFDKNIDYNKLVLESNNFSGADIEEVLRITYENNANNEIDGKNIKPISTDDLIKNIKVLKERNSKEKGKSNGIGFLANI